MGAPASARRPLPARARSPAILTRLSRLAQRRAPAVLVLTAVATVLASFGAVSLGGKLSSGGFDAPGSESMRARDVVERASGVSPGAGLVVLVNSPAGPGAPSTRARVARVAAVLRGDPEIARVVGPYQPDGRAQVARDGSSVFVQGQFAPGGDDARIDAARRVRDALAGEPGVRVGGAAAVAEEVTSFVAHDLTRAELIALPVLFLLALWVFRGAVAALLMPIMGLVVIEGAYFAVGAINALTTMSVFSLNLIVAIGLGLAVDYSLLMVTRFRHEMRLGGDRAAALDATMRTAGKSVAFSAVTVAAALSGLMAFSMNFLFSMGLGGLIVALFAGVAALVVLPALLWVLGERIDALAPRAWQREGSADRRRGAWYHVSRFVLRRPVVVAAVTTGVLLVMALPSLGIHFIPVDSTVMPPSAQSRQVADRLATGYAADTGSAMSVALQTEGIEAPGRAARACVARMARDPGVAGATPATRAGGDVWTFSVVSRDPALSDASVALVGRLRGVPCAGVTSVGGVAADFVDQRAALARGLPVAVGVIVAVTLVALFLMTGSVVLPAKAVILNLISIAATIGMVVWIFQRGHLEGPLDFTARGGLGLTQPVLLGAVAFGLSTDYAVFLLSRIGELRQSGLSNEESIAQGIQHTGRVVTAAALLFAVAVGAFAMSRVVVLKEIGVGAALAVLVDASIVRALLVPASMGILGDANWWAPRFLRRLHDRIGISHDDGEARAGSPTR